MLTIHLPALILFAAFIFSSFILRIRFKKDWLFLFFCGLFFVYFVNLLGYTLFPIPIERLDHMRIGSSFSRNINYLPLWSASRFSLLGREHILNIILTVPLGFLANFLVKMNGKTTLLLGLLAGLFIEGSQLTVSLLIRMPYRIMDVNDVIFNFLGVITGHVIYKSISALLHRFIKIQAS